MAQSTLDRACEILRMAKFGGVEDWHSSRMGFEGIPVARSDRRSTWIGEAFAVEIAEKLTGPHAESREVLEIPAEGVEFCRACGAEPYAIHVVSSERAYYSVQCTCGTSGRDSATVRGAIDYWNEMWEPSLR